MPVPSTIAGPRARSRGRASAASLILLVVVVALATGLASTASAAPALPTCKVADTLTKQRSLSQWPRSVLDSGLRLGSGYAPTDLRSTTTAGLNGGERVRLLVIADLKAMATAARSAGARLAVASAFRSYTTQKATFASLGPRARLCLRAQGERQGGPQRASAGHDARLQELRRHGPVERDRLGDQQGRQVDGRERLEVRLHHELPEGQDLAHLLHVRALALPLRRAGRGRQGARQQAHAARVPVAPAGMARPDPDSDPDATHPTPTPTPPRPTAAKRPVERLAQQRRSAGPTRRGTRRGPWSSGSRGSARRTPAAAAASTSAWTWRGPYRMSSSMPIPVTPRPGRGQRREGGRRCRPDRRRCRGGPSRPARIRYVAGSNRSTSFSPWWSR